MPSNLRARSAATSSYQDGAAGVRDANRSSLYTQQRNANQVASDRLSNTFCGIVYAHGYRGHFYTIIRKRLIITRTSAGISNILNHSINQAGLGGKAESEAGHMETISFDSRQKQSASPAHWFLPATPRTPCGMCVSVGTKDPSKNSPARTVFQLVACFELWPVLQDAARPPLREALKVFGPYITYVYQIP